MYQTTKEKLINLAREKCKLFVTKWELLLVLQMSARDVKIISQFVTGEDDPQAIDINTLFVLITLTSQTGKIQDKLDAIIKFICFETSTDGEENKATLEEAKYIF